MDEHDNNVWGMEVADEAGTEGAASGFDSPGAGALHGRPLPVDPEPPPQVSPGEAHPRKVFKRPQSVLVVIATRGGELLMLRRARPSNFWQSVTGSLAPGESPRCAAIREVREETGLEAGGALVDLKRSVLFPIVKAWRERYAPNVCFNREYWFALVLETRRLIRLDPNEHLEYRWLPAARAAALATSWTNRDAIRALVPC